MAESNQINQFGSAKPLRSGEGTSCAECEAMLADVMDDTLTAKRKADFDRHIATCAECCQMLADAVRGAGLLNMLKSPRPEPPSDLLERILSRTGRPGTSLNRAPSETVHLPTVENAAIDIRGGVPVPVGTGNVLPFRSRQAGRFSFKSIGHTMMQPRLAMTAAMAFFSITLTMNLTGIHLAEFKTTDLAPSNLKHSFYHANASVVRYYDNLRVVYELESRVDDLKRAGEGDSPAARSNSETGNDAGKNPAKPQKTPKSGSGSSEGRSPLSPELKLAIANGDALGDRGPFGPAIRTANIASGIAPATNESEDSQQEGELV